MRTKKGFTFVVEQALPTLASDASDVEVFAVLRMAKDGF